MSAAGLAMVKSFEGFYSKEYKDVAGIPTIGYGTLCTDGLIQCPGPVSEAQAASVLGADLMKKYSGCVKAAVKAPLNNNQFSALVSFAYNAGCGACQNVVKATKLNQPNAASANYAAVPGRMALYNKAKVKGQLTVVKGLVRRRSAEGNLFASNAASQCMPSPTLKAGAPAPAAAPAGKKHHRHGRHAARHGRRHRHHRHHKRAMNTAHEVFNLRRGEVDLPSGTHVTYGGVPNTTHKKLVTMADIAADVKGHDLRRRKHPGPIGRWSKKAQWRARHEPVQNV